MAPGINRDAEDVQQTQVPGAATLGATLGTAWIQMPWEPENRSQSSQGFAANLKYQGTVFYFTLKGLLQVQGYRRLRPIGQRPTLSRLLLLVRQKLVQVRPNAVAIDGSQLAQRPKDQAFIQGE